MSPAALNKFCREVFPQSLIHMKQDASVIPGRQGQAKYGVEISSRLVLQTIHINV